MAHPVLFEGLPYTGANISYEELPMKAHIPRMWSCQLEAHPVFS